MRFRSVEKAAASKGSDDGGGTLLLDTFCPRPQLKQVKKRYNFSLAKIQIGDECQCKQHQDIQTGLLS